MTDGFSGNIALKAVEGTARFVADLLRRSFASSLRSKFGFLISRPATELLKHHLDPNNHNGAVFLGLNGVVVKSHGSATALGVANLSATRDDGSTVATDIRGGAVTAKATDPDSAINVTAEAGTVVLGAITASTGGVNLTSQGGSLATGAIQALRLAHPRRPIGKRDGRRCTQLERTTGQ